MKQINFVTPIPEQKKKEIKYWMILSGLSTIGLILFISISLFARCYHYYLLQSQRAQAEQDHTHCSLVLQTQKEKDSTNSARSQRLATLKRYQNQPNSIATNLRACVQKVGTDAVQSCAIGKESFELSYTSPSIQHAQKTLTNLKAVPGISNLQLVALQRQNNGVTSTVRAKLVKS